MGVCVILTNQRPQTFATGGNSHNLTRGSSRRINVWCLSLNIHENCRNICFWLVIVFILFTDEHVKISVAYTEWNCSCRNPVSPETSSTFRQKIAVNRIILFNSKRGHVWLLRTPSNLSVRLDRLCGILWVVQLCSKPQVINDSNPRPLEAFREYIGACAWLSVLADRGHCQSVHQEREIPQYTACLWLCHFLSD